MGDEERKREIERDGKTGENRKYEKRIGSKTVRGRKGE